MPRSILDNVDAEMLVSLAARLNPNPLSVRHWTSNFPRTSYRIFIRDNVARVKQRSQAKFREFPLARNTLAYRLVPGRIHI
jgi:hypothetical protein